MGMIVAQKRTGRMQKGKLIEVLHKDHTGRILRISKYLLLRGNQKPISEMIYDPLGNSTLYLYNDTGEDIKQVIHFDKRNSPG